MARNAAAGRQLDRAVETYVRRARATVERSRGLVTPEGFAAAGLLLGFGGLVTGRALAGACGAVAGVTAGLLERYRADLLERRGAQLRERLRDQRAEAEVEASELRRRVRELQAALWERDLRDAPAPEAAPAAAAPEAAPAAPAPEAAPAPAPAAVPAAEPAPDTAPVPVLGPPSGPIAEVIDLTEAREQSAAETEATEVPGSAGELDEAAEGHAAAG